jgi:hypothetical protein
MQANERERGNEEKERDVRTVFLDSNERYLLLKTKITSEKQDMILYHSISDNVIICNASLSSATHLH